jgi:hypothetical protein
MRAAWRVLLIALLWLSGASVEGVTAQGAAGQPAPGAPASSAEGVRIEPLRALDLELGDVTGFRITVKDASDGELIVPEIEGLQIRSAGPNVQSMRSIINGRVSESRSLSWDLSIRPQRTGEFVIPLLQLRIDGELRSTPQKFRIRCRENVFFRDHGFVELRVSPERPFVQQSVEVTVRFGFDSFVQQGLVDPGWNVRLPIRIVAPWLVDFPGGLATPDVPSAAQITCVLEGQVAPVQRLPDQKREGESFYVFELQRRFVVNEARVHQLSRVAMQFHWADPRQRPDVFGRRRASRVGNIATESGLALEVRALPEQGRPAGFANAVGRFALRAELDKREFEVGENVQLVLELGGEGNFEFVQMPDLEGLAGFNLFDTKIERRPDRVIARYDLVALSDAIEELPPIELPYFDPERERYDIVRSDALPIEVTPLPAGKELEALPEAREALVPGVDDIFDRMEVVGPAPEQRELPESWLWIALVAPWLLAGAGAAFASWRRRAASDPSRQRRARASRRFAERLDVDGPLRAFSAYLADRLGLGEGALLSKDVEARLLSAGIEEELAKRAAQLIDELGAARYGGALAEEAGAERARELVQAFERGASA